MTDEKSAPASPAPSETTPQSSRPSPTTRSRLRLPIYGLELFVLANLVLTLVILRLHHLRIDWNTFVYIVHPLFVSLPNLFVLGLIVALLLRIVQRKPLGELLARLKRPGWWIEWARMWIAIMLTTYTYFWLKVNVPILNGSSWDEAFWELDILLHLRISPTILVTQLFKGSVLTGFMDSWYTVWKETVMLASSGFLVLYEGEQRRRFAFATVMLWIFGAWGYVLFPAVGPVYVYTAHFVEIMSELPDATAGQMTLWQNYKTILAGMAGEQIHSFNPTQGVAAMPSLHVAAHAFFAFWTWRHFRPLFIFFFVATGLTLIGSVLTGWHYAVDGYAGILLAYVCFKLVDRGFPRDLEDSGPKDPDLKETDPEAPATQEIEAAGAQDA